MSARLESTGNINTLCAAYFISAASDSKDGRYFIVYPLAMMEKFDCRPSSQMCISIVSSRLKTFAISQIAYLLLPIIIVVVVPCRDNTNIRQNTSIPPCCDGYIIIRVVHTNVKPSFTGACNHPPTRNDLSCKQTKYISYPQYSTSENLTTKYANIANSQDSPCSALDTASKTSSTSQVAKMLLLRKPFRPFRTLQLQKKL